MFNERLKALRTEKGNTLKELSLALNVTIRTVCRYEDGTREPSLSVLKALCDFYDVTADYLIGRTDNY